MSPEHTPNVRAKLTKAQRREMHAAYARRQQGDAPIVLGTVATRDALIRYGLAHLVDTRPVRTADGARVGDEAWRCELTVYGIDRAALEIRRAQRDAEHLAAVAREQEEWTGLEMLRDRLRL